MCCVMWSIQCVFYGVFLLWRPLLWERDWCFVGGVTILRYNYIIIIHRTQDIISVIGLTWTLMWNLGMLWFGLGCMAHCSIFTTCICAQESNMERLQKRIDALEEANSEKSLRIEKLEKWMNAMQDREKARSARKQVESRSIIFKSANFIPS